eukprot:TRINITY_DN10688_c0_g1_i2.p1 TRINITY_DN10688_c0_g1~~TRINITY_DN10688_c0_g1_i2.p1  ORF type:complete len:340 (+),score=86.81 TRINITY_DN10688_c0_g1_i2:59-1078(+)
MSEEQQTKKDCKNTTLDEILTLHNCRPSDLTHETPCEILHRRYLTMYDLKIRRVNGKEDIPPPKRQRYDIIGRGRDGEALADGMCVFALNSTNMTATILVEYCWGPHEFLSGLPCGGYEPKKHKSRLDAAACELREEAHLHRGFWVDLLPSSNPKVQPHISKALQTAFLANLSPHTPNSIPIPSSRIELQENRCNLDEIPSTPLNKEEIIALQSTPETNFTNHQEISRLTVGKYPQSSEGIPEIQWSRGQYFPYLSIDAERDPNPPPIDDEEQIRAFRDVPLSVTWDLVLMGRMQLHSVQTTAMALTAIGALRFEDRLEEIQKNIRRLESIAVDPPKVE